MSKKKIGMVKLFFMLFSAGCTFLCLFVLYFFWRLFARMVNLFSAKVMRHNNGKLETPIVFYEHPVTKRVVAFIAVIHLAEAEYFRALERRIESLSGYKILFEGIGKLSQEESNYLTQKERDIADSFESGFESIEKIGEIMSLKRQRSKDGLSYPSSWVNTDIRFFDLVRLFAKHDFHFIKSEKEFNELLENESKQLFIKWLANILFSQFLPVTAVLNILNFFSRRKRIADKLILDARNKEAIFGINKYLVEGNVATIWGAMHLVGIEKELKRAGFREVHREWFTAYHVRDYHIFETLKKEGLINSFKEAANSVGSLKKE